MTLTENSLLNKSTSSTSTKWPLHTEIQHFFGEYTDKNTAQNALKRAISSEKFDFSWEKPSPLRKPFT